MTTPEEDYERRLENMLAALARAWDEAVTEACCESCGCLRAKNVPNPYAKET